MREMNSTFSERSKACTIYNSTFDVKDRPQQFVKPEFKEFEVCLKDMMDWVIENER